MYFDNKTISSFPIAIGTAIALEALFIPRMSSYDPDRVKPDKVNVRKYNTCYISISTLYRNLLSSVDSNVVLLTTPEEIATELSQEISIISNLFFNEGNDICKPIFYIVDYDNIVKRYTKKKIVFRTSTTDRQKIYDDKFTKMLPILMQQVEIEVIKDLIVPKVKNTSLIITHIAYDLLSYKNFNKLDLLESHTGKLKDKYKFSTKYQPFSTFDVSSLPFNKKLLLTIGDRSFIKPSSTKLKKTILEIANKKRWTTHTTEEKMLFDLNNGIKEPYVLQWFNSL